MADPDLIAETNRLLRQLLESDAEAREQSKASRERLNAFREDLDAKREERRKTRLREDGFPEDASEDDLDARRKEAHRRSEENIAVSREREARYREELLQELRVQSDLLRQIAERLER